MKQQALDFGSIHDLRVLELSPKWDSLLSPESASGFFLSLCISVPQPQLTHVHALSLNVNKQILPHPAKKKKEREGDLLLLSLPLAIRAHLSLVPSSGCYTDKLVSAQWWDQVGKGLDISQNAMVEGSRRQFSGPGAGEL